MVEKPITLSQALEGYFLAAHARRLSRHTIADYSSAYRKFERFLGTDPPLASISAADIRTFQNSLNGRGRRLAARPYTLLVGEAVNPKRVAVKRELARFPRVAAQGPSRFHTRNPTHRIAEGSAALTPESQRQPG